MILVTPEFVDPIDGCEVPCGGPGYVHHVAEQSRSVLRRPRRSAGALQPDSRPDGLRRAIRAAQLRRRQRATAAATAATTATAPVITDGMQHARRRRLRRSTMPDGVGHDRRTEPSTCRPTRRRAACPSGVPAAGRPAAADAGEQPQPRSRSGNAAARRRTGRRRRQHRTIQPSRRYSRQCPTPAGRPAYTAPRPYSPPRQPVFMRNASRPNNPQPAADPPASAAGRKRPHRPRRIRRAVAVAVSYACHEKGSGVRGQRSGQCSRRCVRPLQPCFLPPRI